METKIRLNKYLSLAGVASRRKADQLISSGRVSVNGSVMAELGGSIDPGNATVTIDGKRVRAPSSFRYHMFNKPAGYLCSRGDPYGRPTIYDILPAQLKDLKYVGRLDQDTEGLLLLTDDGGLIESLTHPKHNIPRKYIAWVRGIVADEELEPIRQGMEIEGEKTRPARARVIKTDRSADMSMLDIVLQEGKKREVRLMCRQIGHHPQRLKRVSFGSLKLDELPSGQTQELTKHELLQLKNMGLPQTPVPKAVDGRPRPGFKQRAYAEINPARHQRSYKRKPS